MDWFGFPIESSDVPPAPETGVYHYWLDVADDGRETMAEASELADGSLFVRIVQVAPRQGS